MQFISYSAIPPGGWKLRIPQFGDGPNATVIFGKTFVEAAEWGRDMAAANPRFNLPTDYDYWAQEVANQTYEDLRSRFPNEIGRWVSEDGPPKLPAWNPATPYKSPWAGNVAAVKKVSAGVGVLINWLGTGLEPVEIPLAVKRAEICATCPQNRKGDWTTFFTGPVAAMLKQQMEVKAEMKLTTPFDDMLGVCEACSCQLKLKIYTPLDHITDSMSDEVRAKLDPRCWVTKE